MKSSGSFSAPTRASSPKGPPRSFALTGPSAAIDLRFQAIRPDLADIRLADQVFAPHYAAPKAMCVIIDATLRARAASDSAVIGALAPGDGFEALDFAANAAWGISTKDGLVGYVDRSAIDFLEPEGTP